MKKKTALQQLIDILKSEDMLPLPYPYDINELLETEREQIEEAYNNGAKDITYNLELKEQYYKDTYE